MTAPLKHNPRPFKCLHITGRKNHGKTTLIEELVPLLVKRHLRVVTVKYTANPFDVDRRTTDTFRHRKSGGSLALAITPVAAAIFRNRAPDESFFDTLTPLLAAIGPIDLLLIEGGPPIPTIPRVEVWRAERREWPLYRLHARRQLSHDNPRALITDDTPVALPPDVAVLPRRATTPKQKQRLVEALLALAS